MPKRTQKQNNQYHAIVSKMRLTKEQKSDLILSFSNGRTSSSADLSREEMQLLINRLNAMQYRHISNSNVRVNFYADDPADKMRKKCLSIVHELGWEMSDGQINWQTFNAWLFKYGYLHKSFNNYTYEELPRLVTQLENLLKSNYERI